MKEINERPFEESINAFRRKMRFISRRLFQSLTESNPNRSLSCIPTHWKGSRCIFNYALQLQLIRLTLINTTINSTMRSFILAQDLFEGQILRPAGVFDSSHKGSSEGSGEQKIVNLHWKSDRFLTYYFVVNEKLLMDVVCMAEVLLLYSCMWPCYTRIIRKNNRCYYIKI